MGLRENDRPEHCTFPDCGCSEARVCPARGGANSASHAWNQPKYKAPRRPSKTLIRKAMEMQRP